MTSAKKPRKPKKPGRRTKFTPEVQKRIIHAVRNGNTYDVASRYGGVDPKTFHNWMALGEKAKKSTAHRKFYELVVAARAEIVAANVQSIRQAMHGVEVVTTVTKTYQKVLPGSKEPVTVTEVTETRTVENDWRAGAWWLERMERQTFGKIRMDVGDHKHEVTVVGNLETMSDAELASIAAGNVPK